MTSCALRQSFQANVETLLLLEYDELLLNPFTLSFISYAVVRLYPPMLTGSLTLLWYHGVYVTPVLFDSRFFFETVTNTDIAFYVFFS